MTRFLPMQREKLDPAAARTLARTLSVSPITAAALLRRGIKAASAAELFLRPTEAALHDPMLLPDMEAALSRIRQAINARERICIYGDYDADGVCATAILFKQLRRMGASAECFVPSRHEDGYGMHAHTVSMLCENGIDLIVTVDNGITALDEIALCAEEYGVDVIVTDHHIPGPRLPGCRAVVAASRTDSEYPYPSLCGAGIAFKLATALNGGAIDPELLGLAAVATMADVVPLDGENRALVQLGLPHVPKNRGLKALLSAAALDTKPLDATTLSFGIAPRLNAAGRMGDASRAILLLTGDDALETERLAAELQNDNTRRRDDEARLLADLRERYDEAALGKGPAIIAMGEDWNAGVLGIAASKLSERYFMPVLLFTRQQEALVGSCRSTEAIPLYETLLPFKDRFDRFGGHARAAGITIKPERFSDFSEAYCAYLTAHFSSESFDPVYTYEQELQLPDVTEALVNELALLAPFGEGNPAPQFLIKNAVLSDVRKIGRDQTHVSLTVSQGPRSLRAVGFGFGAQAETMQPQAELLCTLENDSFQNRTRTELRLVAFRNADPAEGDGKDGAKIVDAILCAILYNDRTEYDKLRALFSEISESEHLQGVFSDRERMRGCYRALRTALSTGPQPGRALLTALDKERLLALAVFAELGFFLSDPATGTICQNPACAPRDLNESELYLALCAGSEQF